MTIVAFDTHKYVKRLTTAGMPESQAEAIADEHRSLIENQLATKQDIKELEAVVKTQEANLQRDIKELEAANKRDLKELEVALRRDNKELEQKLTIRLGLMLVAAVALISALIKFP